ncbi:MAG: hypothetical protein WAK84_01700 [Candidatus Cybelea sp.]
MFDESRYREGAGGGAHEPGRTAAQPARVPQRSSDDRVVVPGEARVFVVGANASTLAVVNSLRPEEGRITAHLIPLAATPLGLVLGEGRQEAAVPLDGLFDWIDRTFPADDDYAFVASVRDLELLIRTGWHSPYPQDLDERSVLNVEDIPDEMANALARPPVALEQCAACRRLCIRDDFVWKEKQLCAWDYHAQVFGKRGPWREGAYEERHFETLPSCAYVAPGLLTELGVDVLLTVAELSESAVHAIVNRVLELDPARSNMAVKTESGIVLLREAATPSARKE